MIATLAGCQEIYLGKMPFLNPVIVIAGESNAGGIGQNDSLSTLEYSARSSVKIFNNNLLLFQTLHIGVNNLLMHQGLADTITHGIENGLANCADSGLLGTTPIYMLKAGEGASQIAWWNDSTYVAYFGVNPWQQCKARMDSALVVLTALSDNTRPPIYLVWTQGINDAIAGVNSLVWKADTKTFFTKFRLRYGNVPIFMTQLPPTYSTYNTRITELATEVNNLYQINTTAAPLVDINHWSYTGFKVIASAFIALLNTNYRYRLQ